MNIPKIVCAMEYIDGDLISGAENYKPKKGKSLWLKWAAAAACICLIAAAVPFINPYDGNVTDIEPMVEYSLEEAASIPGFGELFPAEILEGYVLEGEFGVYNETVLDADFYNEALGDVMTIRIASKDWFAKEMQNTDFGEVQYTEYVNGGRASSVYIDGGDYVICYSFSNSDIANNADFYDMVNSAAYFSD